MARNATVFRVLIASPSDVQKERETVATVIERWNAANSQAMGIVLEAVRWESHTHPASGNYAQGLINQQIVDDADVVVGIFWHRLGTPTPKADSGTLEEIEHLRSRHKRVLLYFSSAPLPKDADKDQYLRLQQYKSGLRQDTLYREFGTTEELDRLFSGHISKVAHEIAQETGLMSSGSPSRVANIVALQPLSKPRYVSSDDSDTWRESPQHEDSPAAAIAIFQNQPIPGVQLPRIRGLAAQITFYEANGGEVERVYNGCWLGDPYNHTDLGATDTRELIIALAGPEGSKPVVLENTRSKLAHYSEEGVRSKPLERSLYDVLVKLIGSGRLVGDLYAEFRFNLDLRHGVPVLRLNWVGRNPLEL